MASDKEEQHASRGCFGAGHLGSLVLVLKLGSKNEGKEPGGRSFKQPLWNSPMEEGQEEYNGGIMVSQGELSQALAFRMQRSETGLLIPVGHKSTPGSLAQIVSSCFPDKIVPYPTLTPFLKIPLFPL